VSKAHPVWWDFPHVMKRKKSAVVAVLSVAEMNWTGRMLGIGRNAQVRKCLDCPWDGSGDTKNEGAEFPL